MHKVSMLSLLLLAAPLHAAITLPVTSPAVRFSPGNWSLSPGTVTRTTWNNGAWCEWRWTTPSDQPTAAVQMTNGTPGSAVSYFIDGALVDNVPVSAAGTIPITGITGRGAHTLRLYTRNSQQTGRWEGANAFTVAGLVVDDGATPLPAGPSRPCVLIIGDSITEGIQAGNGGDSSLADYSFLLGQGLRGSGYATGVSACGYSGWIRHGDAGGDVPGYYAVTGGVYSEKDSRWDKIDAHTSLLDGRGHLSAYGGTGQEPAAILINYIVNETLTGADPHDIQASITGCLAALRKAAPDAWVIVLAPPGLYDTRVYGRGPDYIATLKAGAAAYRKAHPTDARTVLLDLGPDVSHALASPLYGGGIHPNAAGHAYLAPLALGAMLKYLPISFAPVS